MRSTSLRSPIPPRLQYKCPIPGRRDDEVAQLEGVSEGCQDESVQRIEVRRPRGDVEGGRVLVAGEDGEQLVRIEGDEAGDWVSGEPRVCPSAPAVCSAARRPQALARRQPCGERPLAAVPLGSIRASMGAWSRWEDCNALVSFIKTHYMR